MNERTTKEIEKELKVLKLSQELLSEYKETMRGLDKKVINKNVENIRTQHANYWLRETEYRYELHITPLNSDGYSYVDYYLSNRLLKFDDWQKKHQIYEVLEGRTKQTLNYSNLEQFINEQLTRIDNDINYYTNVFNDERINEYKEKFEKFMELREELNEYEHVCGKTFRDFLYNNNERTSKGDNFAKYNTEIY